MSVRLLLAPALILATACASAPKQVGESIPAAWLNPPQATKIEGVHFDNGMALPGSLPPPASTIHLIDTGRGFAIANGEKALTLPLPAIESFDYSPQRKEVVFSARREKNFDIALVSSEGSEIHWVPEDPADETGVQWAPRGNKVSYVVHAPGGDLVRTVHIPTSMQLSVDFPDGRVTGRAWSADGERMAVVWQSADASDRIEEMRFGGEERKTIRAAAVKLDVDSEPVPGAVLLRPSMLHYGEKLPLVIWRANDIHEWDDARATLEQRVRVACLIVDRDPDQALLDALRSRPWIDQARTWAVGMKAPAGGTSIMASSEVPAGRYRQDGNVVLVGAGVVKSVAAGMIAGDVKGQPASNGSHR